MLSVVTICKNELANVKGFVSSWSDVADEIVIVDTGSTDGTREALRELEDGSNKMRVYTFPWINDFSAARNYAASKALGTWILWADMDDRVHLDSIPRIRELVRTRERAYAFQVASDMGKNCWHRFMQIRMYPNLPSMKFHGKIHENLNLSLKLSEIPVVANDQIMIAHLGYADESVRKNKAIRNLDMLLHEGEPTTPDELAQVGDALYVLGKFRVGIGYYEEAVRRSEDPREARKALAEKLIVGYLHWNAMEKAHDTIKTCLDPYSVSHEFWIGEYHRMIGMSGTALMHYKRCLTGHKSLSSRECNGDVMQSEARIRILELESQCVPA